MLEEEYGPTLGDEARDLTAACELGASSCIEKPVSVDKFMDVAAHIELCWCLFNERAYSDEPPHPRENRMHKVLIPVDGSPEALAAVHHVLRLAGAGLRLRCVLANVQESASLYELVTAHDPAVLQRVAEQAGRDLLKPAQQLLAAAGIPCESEVVQTGEVAQALIDAAERHAVHAIVMGAGASGLGERVLGSVSLDLVRAAPVPVTVVRAVTG